MIAPGGAGGDERLRLEGSRRPGEAGRLQGSGCTMTSARSAPVMPDIVDHVAMLKAAGAG
jgi:hypothetical protein